MPEGAISSRDAWPDMPGGVILGGLWAVTPDLLCVLGLDGSILASNPAWQATLGWTAQELRSTPFLEFVHPDDRARTVASWNEVREDQPALRFQNRYRTRSGEWRWLSWVAVLEVDRVYCSARDVHLQKEQAAALARTVAERDRLWQNSQDVLVVTDLQGKLVSVSPAVTRILGWTPEELLGRPVRELVVEDDVATAEQALSRAAREPQSAIETRSRHKDGGFRWLSWVSAPDGDLIYATGRHITAEKAAREALALAAAERDRIMRNSRDLIVVIDLRGQLLSVNEATQPVLGWRPDEMLGRPIMDFIHPDHRPPLRPNGGLIAERYAEPSIFLNRFLCKDGSHRWMSWSTMTENGLIYSQGRDVTAEREQAAALQAAEESLRQSQKMEAVGQLTGGIAHDFNNLLAAITGSLEIVQRRITGARWNEIERHATAALGAARRAAALTHRLLAFSRRQALDPRPVDVNRLLAGIEDLTRRTVGPSIVLERVADTSLWTTLVDANQLENAILNLCINARDAMPEGGRISLETANQQLDSPTARALAIPAGDYVRIKVSDTGNGMSPEVAAKAFEPFFTTKPLGRGTGLGLSMVYGFVHQSGGQVRIESAPGRGTTLNLLLPRHAGEVGAEAESVAPVARVERRRTEAPKTVLVVDDEPTLRLLIVDVLTEAGFAVLAAEDGVGGMQILQSPTRIDLLVADIGLPGGLNGHQVAEAARLRRPNLKVLFITGYAETAGTGGGSPLEAGTAILTKPFEMDRFEAKIRSMLAS